MVLGQTSAWPNESAPPAPPLNTIAMSQPFCATLANLYWVYQVENSAEAIFTFNDANNNPVYFGTYTTATQADNGQCTLVLAQAQVTGTNIIAAGSANFRQIGFATNIVATSGHSSDTFLPSTHVSSWGDLESVQNRTVVTLISGSTYTGNSIFSF
jgi:hypothetical protein